MEKCVAPVKNLSALGLLLLFVLGFYLVYLWRNVEECGTSN